MAQKYDYDLFVIGAGSGGVRAARMAAEYGAKVAIAEEYRIGGTCVIRGCVPKKLFVYASHFAEEFEDAAAYGWDLSEAEFSWARLVANKDKEIDRLNGIYKANLEKAGVEIFLARAVLEDSHEIHLEGKAISRTLRAKHILIATGAAPFLPPHIEGIEHAITSNEAFHLEELPSRIVVVGGGYIAVEFAGIFNGLGVETALLYRGEEILRGFDQDMRETLHEEMQKKGIEVRVKCDVMGIETINKGYKVTLKDGAGIRNGFGDVCDRAPPEHRRLGLGESGRAARERGRCGGGFLFQKFG